MRLGQQPRSGAVPPRSIFPSGALRGAERPLTHQFIGSKILRFGFRAVEGPADAAVVKAGGAGWFGLASWKIPDDLGQQAQLAGYRMSLGPTDPLADYLSGNVPSAGAGAGSYASQGAAWGDANEGGDGAVIVIGTDLPCNRGEWKSGPIAPGCEEGAQTNEVVVSGISDAWQIFKFAPGRPGQSPQPRVFYSSQTTPIVVNLTAGARLDVALVIEREACNNAWGQDPAFVGHCYGELLIAASLSAGEFAE